MPVPPGTRWVTYRVKARGNGSKAAGPKAAPRKQTKLALLRISGGDRPALFEAVKIGQLLRGALQADSARLEGRLQPRRPSAAGRGTPGEPISTGTRTTFPCPTPTAAKSISSLVWAPEGLGGEEVAALVRVRKLYDPIERRSKIGTKSPWARLADEDVN